MCTQLVVPQALRNNVKSNNVKRNNVKRSNVAVSQPLQISLLYTNKSEETPPVRSRTPSNNLLWSRIISAESTSWVSRSAIFSVLRACTTRTREINAFNIREAFAHHLLPSITSSPSLFCTGTIAFACSHIYTFPASVTLCPTTPEGNTIISTTSQSRACNLRGLSFPVPSAQSFLLSSNLYISRVSRFFAHRTTTLQHQNTRKSQAQPSDQTRTFC